ncbi:MAG: DUF6159 family protein [Dokdonella sp.]|uniref:DUF6159 family protein n=1 Tax=Dokdonella sp. TaxID=2291710 RepID=UPI00326487A2
MGRFARSWELVKASVAVLRADHRLLVFPLMAGVCTMIVSASFLGPLALGGVLDQFENAQRPWWMAPIMFLFYLVQYFVIFFFNSALVGAARIRLDGGSPSVRDGFRIAASRWTQILGYALIAATVGMILRAIEERAGFIGRWIAALLGVTWTMATFLVVPVLVSGNVGPVDAVKQSAELLKRTWGENLTGNVGIGLVSGLAIVAWVMMSAGLVALATSTQSVAAVIAAVAVGIIGIVTLSLVQSALQGVYAAALHRYAQTGDAGIGFERALLADAFKLKA